MDSQNVERVLDQQGRTMAWLARKAGVSVSYAWRMLKGERPLTPEFMAAAAEALGVPEDILFPTEQAPKGS
ncbi:MAG TPA: helix-turn-helix transcriptional regulator [Candidatus Limnocylindrales bacterium]|nr:helix-turn-helix transcriptional regulator [Candidatus Limnocylindrales bacterium]